MREENIEPIQTDESLSELEQDLRAMRPDRGALEWNALREQIDSSAGSTVSLVQSESEVQVSTQVNMRALALSWAGGMLAGGLLVFVCLADVTGSSPRDARAESSPNDAQQSMNTGRTPMPNPPTDRIRMTQKIDQLMDRDSALAVGSHFVSKRTEIASHTLSKEPRLQTASPTSTITPNPLTKERLLRELIDDPRGVL